MKKISSYGIFILLSILCSMLLVLALTLSHRIPRSPTLQKASDLKADVNGYVVNLSWVLPASNEIEGVMLISNGNSSNPIRLDGKATSYQVKGQPMEEEYLYTVKVLYEGGYVSEGVSVSATIPYVELANVTDLKATVSGRTVTLDWILPTEDGITAVKIIRDGETDAATIIEGQPTSSELKGQPG